jgi:hypothetical protein
VLLAYLGSKGYQNAGAFGTKRAWFVPNAGAPAAPGRQAFVHDEAFSTAMLSKARATLSLSRKQLLNPSKNNPQDSRDRIAGYFRHHGNDLQNLRRAITRRAPDSANGGVRGKFAADLLVALESEW